MTALSLTTPQVDPTAAPAATSAAELARRGQIHATAQKFEASFLTSVLQTMFQSVPTAAPFGGGPGEDMWKSFLAEAMAKNMARRGGVGIAPAVEREMLKLQGLQDAAPTASGAAGQTGAGAARPGAVEAAQAYPGLAASAQKVATHARWPSVGAAASGAPKQGAAHGVTVQ